MKKHYWLIVWLFCSVFVQNITAQEDYFPYQVSLTPISISGLPGLHSYTYGQHNGQWLILGGRLDGLHARQPNSSFPASQNNQQLFVVNLQASQVWSTSVMSLPIGIREQLQSTNMNFYQSGDHLVIVGGYAFSATANNHITFPRLTVVHVPGVINAIQNGTDLNPHFKEITNDFFAVTGGQLGKIGNTFYLVGGHRFDGRYNPMNNPTFTQTYTNQIRKFTLDWNATPITFNIVDQITDPVHLRRRDYNLVPQVFPNGALGYTISSGVFQLTADLPFLYPVDITENGYQPQEQFSQYLSNYHSGKVGLYDAQQNQMHSLFFGGLSQYYYQNGTLIQDNQVPFVKTISRMSRMADGTLTEYVLPIEMPNLKGTSAEFIPNLELPLTENKVILLNDVTENSFVVGHIYGGIQTQLQNPFANNQTAQTQADPSIFEVRLTIDESLSHEAVQGGNPFQVKAMENPIRKSLGNFELQLPYASTVTYIVYNTEGKVLKKGSIDALNSGAQKVSIDFSDVQAKQLMVSFVFDKKFYRTLKLMK